MRIAWLIPLLAVGLAGGCKLAKPDEEAKEPAPATSSPPKELVLPVAEAPLDREALLLAAARAASAAAIGADDGAEQGKLAGRRFELRIRFGCPTGSDGKVRQTAGWKATFEEPRRILRLRIDPDVNEASPLLRDGGVAAFEDASGFWLPSPWVWTAACPPPPAPAPQSEASPQATPKPNKATARAEPVKAEAAAPLVFPRVGIVQGFGADDPRTHRARQAYEVTRRLAADAQPSAKGYDLVIGGRLRRLGAGKVITCGQDRPDQPPACLITADFDRVALTRGDTGEQIAEWSGTGGI